MKGQRGAYLGITHSLFSGPDFQELPGTARWTFVCLKKNMSGSAGIDVWYGAELLARLTTETGWTPDVVTADLAILEERGWIKREGSIVWVVEHLRYDPNARASEQNKRTHVRQHLHSLPRRQIVKDFVAHYPDFLPADECRADGLAWALTPDKLPPVESERSPAGVQAESGRTIPIPKATPTPRRAASGEADAASGGIKMVLDRYQALHPKRKVKGLDGIVRKALNFDFTAPELIEAIEGNATDPWHRERRKHELSYVLRNPDKINEFRERRSSPQAPSGKPAGVTGADIVW